MRADRRCGASARLPATEQSSEPVCRLPLLVLMAGGLLLLSGFLASKLPDQFAAVVTVRRSFDLTTPHGRAAAADDACVLPLDPPIVTAALLAAGFDPRMVQAEQIEDWRQRLQIERSKHRADADAIQLCCKAADPTTASAVAGALARQLVERDGHCRMIAERAQELTDARKAVADADQRHRLLCEQRRSVDSQIAAYDRPALEAQSDEVSAALQSANRRLPSLSTAPRDANEDPRLRLAPSRPADAPDTLVESALRRCVVLRQDLIGSVPDDHPAVLRLEQKIETLALQCGIADPIRWCEQASLGVAKAKSDPSGGQSNCPGRAEVELLTQERLGLQQALLQIRDLESQAARLKRETELALRQSRAAFERMRRAEESLATAQAECGVRSTIDNGGAVQIQYVGPCRRKWFLVFAAVSITFILAVGRLLTAR